MSINLNMIRAAVSDAVKERALLAGGDAILDASDQDVPVDKGDLLRSRYARVSSEGELEIGYRDEVAAIVHEDLDASHGNGTAKYLEKAMNSRRAAALDAMAGEIRRAL